MSRGEFMKHLCIFCITAIVLSLASNVRAVAPEIELWYGGFQRFGQPGNSQRWVNILGTVTDNDGIASLSYSLNGGPNMPLSIGSDLRRLVDTGDFNIEIDYLDLNPGNNQVEIRATDNAGERRTRRMTVQYSEGNLWPDTYSVDWQNVSNIQDVAQVVDGRWTLGPNGVRTEQIGYDRVMGLGGLGWVNFEITVPITIHSFDSGAYDTNESVAPAFGITLRWRGHSDWSDIPEFADWQQPRIGWKPSGASSWYDWPDENNPQNTRLFLTGDDGQDFDPANRTLAFNVTYMQKIRCETLADGRTEYRLKVWQAGTPEPAAWEITHYEQDDLPSGSVIFVAHHVDVTVGDIQVTPLPDNTIPEIQNVRFELDGSDGYLTWQTSKPTNSQIKYGLTENYEIGQVASNSYRLTHRSRIGGLMPNTIYHYNIHVEDKNGKAEDSGDLWFSTSPQAPTLVSDHFNSPQLDLDKWTVIDPLDDAEFSMNGSEAVIYVPPGSVHDAWSSTGDGFANTLARIMQPVHNVDFNLEVKFNSSVQEQFQQQGIVVEQNKNNLLRFEFLSDGNGVRIFVAEIVDGIASSIRNRNIATGGTAPLYARLQREGMTWTFLYSLDAVNWSTGTTIERGITMTGIGLYAANQNGPDHTLRADYFHNMDALPSNSPPDQVPPQIADVSASPEAGQAIISWRTNELATGTVRYGTSPNNMSDRVDINTPAIWHSAILANLDSLTTYYFSITAKDSRANAETSSGYQFSTPGTESTNIRSDNFAGQQLDTNLWTVIDPLNDAAFEVKNSQLTIGVPSNVTHEVWGDNSNPFSYNVPRVMQASNDGNFEIEVKFDSKLTQGYQEQGILIEQDNVNLLRCELFTDGNDTKLFVARITDGIGQSFTNTVISETGVAPQFMRVKRVGDQWTVSYSLDGSAWLLGAGFASSMQVSAVGIHAGNTAGVSHTAQIDYFYNTAAIPPDTEAPQISTIEVIPGKTDAVFRWVTSEPTTSEIRFGLDTNYDSGSIENNDRIIQHEMSLTDIDSLTEYHAVILATDASGNVGRSMDIVFRTGGQEPTTLRTDDFNDPDLNTNLWTFINPKDDAILEIQDGEVRIGVTAESGHDVWGDNQNPFSNTVPRIRQAANDVDFEVQVKYNSALLQGFQQQGVLVEQDERTLLRFELFSDGSKVFIFAATILDGIGQAQINKAIPAALDVPMYMDIKRNGDHWTQSFSSDGITWDTIVEFDAEITVTGISAHIGNSGVAHTGRLDHFKVIDLPTSVKQPPALPSSFALHPNYPNPFNISTTLSFDIPASAGFLKNGSLTIYNSRGEIVKVLQQGSFAPGSYRIIWNGESSDRKVVASGVYYGVFNAQGFHAVQRMLLLK